MNRRKRHAAWAFEEGIHLVGDGYVPMHEPLYFLRSRGGSGDNEEQIFNFRRTRAYLEFRAKLGCTQVWFNWWKGYGLEHERPGMAQVAELFPICKELGLRAVCYHTFGSLTLDTLLHEEPDAGDWIARTQAGQPTSCQTSHQCFRNRPCFSSEGYLAYMEKVLGECLDAGADGIHFDNIGMQAEPEACHCPRCEKLFRAYLQERFGGDLGEEIFGMRDFTHGTVPWFNQHNQANKLFDAKVPLHRAWIDFKCDVLARAGNRLVDFIRGRKADAFVEMNAMEDDGFAAAFWRGNDYDAMLPKLDMVCDEGSAKDTINKHGAMVGPMRSKKWARALGCAHAAGGTLRIKALDFAEDLAFSNAPQPFWKRHRDYQLKAESLAVVAVLRERNSLAYNRLDPWEETIAAEQYLIERRIPFDIVSNDQLESLDDRYRILIVAGAEVMSDAIRDTIEKWVAAGGSLLLAGKSGMFDEHYRVRRVQLKAIETMEDYRQAQKSRNAFHALIGADPHGQDEEILMRSHRSGRVGWIKRLDVDRTPRTPQYWTIPAAMHMLPRNAHKLDELFSFLLPDGLALRVDTPSSIYVHHSVRADTSEQLIHLINFSYPEQTAYADVRIRLGSEPHSVVSVSLDDTDTDHAPREEAFEMQGDWLMVRVAKIQHHRSLIVRMDAPSS